MTWQDNVNEFIKNSNMLQRELAKELGITEPSISRKLRKERKWSVDDLIKISKMFGVSIDELIGGY